MKKVFILMQFFFMLLICKPFLLFATDTPQLVLDPGGHKSRVWKVLFTNDEKYIVTCSYDKLIKVWDIATGECIRTIRGYMQGSYEGIVYSIALTPDDKYLVAGGWFKGKNYGDEGLGAIRIYDFNTGKLLRLLKGHKSAVLNLEFSHNGKYLASASADHTVILWDLFNARGDLKSRINKKKLSYHKKGVYGISFSYDDKYLASVSDDRSIATWALSSLVSGKSKYNPYKTLNNAHNKEIKRVEYSMDNKYLVTGSKDGTVKLWNAKNLKLVKIINTADNFYTQEVKFSPDNRYIIFGGTNKDYYDNKVKCPVYFYNMLTNKIEKIFWAHNNTIQSIAISKSGKLIASTGGNNNQTYIYNSGTLQVIQTIIGKGRTKFSTGFGKDNKTIYFGNMLENNEPNNYGNINKSFSFVDLTVKDSNNKDYTRGYNIVNDQTIDFTGGMYNRTIKIAGKTITLPSENDTIFCYTFTPDGKYAIIGSDFVLTKVDVNTGGIVGNFVGHGGSVFSVSVSSDSKYLISSSKDQTIKLWDINSFKKNEFVNYEWLNDDLKEIVKKNYPKLDLHKQLDIEKLYNYLLRDYGNKEAQKLVKYPVTEPIVTIFISSDNKYLLWTPDSYYTGDKELYKYIGWHINQGEDKNAKFYPFEQFDLKYNRPDIILQRLGYTNKFVINAYYSMYQQRLKKMGFKESDLIGEIHIPDVTLRTDIKGNVTNKQKINLSIDAKDNKYKLDRLNVFVNGVPIYGINGISLKARQINEYFTTLPVNLAFGKNKVQVSVLNSAGAESYKETINIQCNKTFVKPNLYIATIGVSKYLNKNWDLQFADKDAKDLVSIYQKEKNVLFNDIFVLSLNNNKAVKRNIDKINEFFSKSKVDDMVVLFISGHGMRDEHNNYYFCTYNINFNNPSKNGYLFNELDLLFNDIPSVHKLFLMDTCFSGEADSNDYNYNSKRSKTNNGEVRGKVFETSDKQGEKIKITKRQITPGELSLLKRTLFTNIKNNTGSVVITSSSGAEYSYEGIDNNGKKIENGVFTYSLISGLQSKKCDKNGDNRIQVSEIMDWVHDTVIKLTGGRQTPTMRKGNIEFDYSIY